MSNSAIKVFFLSFVFKDGRDSEMSGGLDWHPKIDVGRKEERKKKNDLSWISQDRK